MQLAAQAAARPDAVAAVFEDARLSYGELEARANQLAHHLRALGVGAETVVGLCLERSLEMLVGLIGILKAGGGVSAARPELPGRALGVHAGGCRGGACDHQCGAGGSAGPATARGGSSLMRRRRRSRREPTTRAGDHARGGITSPTSSIPQAPPEPPRASPSPMRALAIHLAPPQIDRSDTHARVLQFASLSFDAASVGDCASLCDRARRW